MDEKQEQVGYGPRSIWEFPGCLFFTRTANLPSTILHTEVSLCQISMPGCKSQRAHLLPPLSALFLVSPAGCSCPKAYFHRGKTHPLDGKSSQNPNYLTLFSDRHHHRHPNHCSAIIATLALVCFLAVTAYHYSQPQLSPASPSLSPFCFRLARFLRSV